MEAERAVGSAVYVFKRDHRNGSPEKSQWMISPDREVACFERMQEKGWNAIRQGWSLHLEEGRISYLGLAVDHRRPLFFARFLAEPAAYRWHGFPADPLLHAQDIPDGRILLAWVDLRYLSSAKMRKILRQQDCRIAP